MHGVRTHPFDPRLPDCDPPAARPSRPIGPNGLTGAMAGTLFASLCIVAPTASPIMHIRSASSPSTADAPPAPSGAGGSCVSRCACFSTRHRGAAFAYLTSAADRSGRIARPLRVRIGAFIQSGDILTVWVSPEDPTGGAHNSPSPEGGVQFVGRMDSFGIARGSQRDMCADDQT